MQEGEQILCAFGPFGVSVCDGPYSMFKWQKTNIVRVELTDRRVRGLKRRAFSPMRRPPASGQPVFDIPYSSVLSVTRSPHPGRLGLMDVLEFSYGDVAAPQVLSVAAYKGPVAKALAVLQGFLPGERIALS